MKKPFVDLFTSNPKYEKTALYPWDIIEPIGYNTFKQQISNAVAKSNRLELFEFPEDPLVKIINNRK